MNKQELIDKLMEIPGNPNVVLMDSRLNTHFASGDGTPQGITGDFIVSSFTPITEDGDDLPLVLSIEFESDETDHEACALDKFGHGVELIAAERERQINEEGWTPKHDDNHGDKEFELAAVAYTLPEQNYGMPFQKTTVGFTRYMFWPWEQGAWKPTPEDRIRELTKAGALIAAGIDRLKRKKDREG